MNARTAVLTLSLLGTPVAAWAQAPATTFDGLGALVRVQETVTVTDAQGATIRGKIASISGDALEITVDEKPVRFHVLQVQRVSAKRRDSLLNGSLIGFAVGAVGFGGLVALDSQGGYFSSAAIAVRAALLGGAIGTVLGTVIDFSIKKPHVIYQRPSGGGTPRIAIAPAVRHRGIGVFAALRF